MLSALLVFLTVFCSAQIPAHALTSESRVVRVAFPIQPGLTDFDQYGNRTGYTFEYLEEVAQYTGWDYEFVDVPGSLDESLTTLMEMLQNGEIDLMGAMLYAEGLGELYDYSGHSYGAGETVLQVPYDADQNVVINSQVEQYLRIAVVSETGRSIQELENYCEMNLITPAYVLCADELEQIEAVRQGRADMLLNSSMNNIEGVHTIAKFASKPIYFVTTKGSNTGLLEELNAAMLSIEQTDPTFTTALYEKYFVSVNDELILSQEERRYIAAAGALRVGVLTEQPPYQYLDEKGEMTGISVDLLRYISDKTGLTFQMVPAATQQELFEMARSGQVDLVAGISYDYDLARENALSLSRPYISSQYILMKNGKGGEDDDAIAGRLLALTRNTAYYGETVGSPVWYDNIVQCIRAVAKGDADYTYADAYTAQYHINLPEYQNLRLVPQSYAPRRICFGIVKPGRQELLSILNKSVTTISENEMQGITNRNIMKRRPFNLGDLVRQNPIGSVVLLAGVFLGIIAILLGYLHQRERTSKRNALELKKHFRVYALVNEFFFEYDFRTKSAMVSVPGKDGEKPRMLKYAFSAPADGAADDREKFFALISSGQSGIKEARFRCEDGKTHWVRLVLETVYDGSEPAYTLGKINIIDEEKREREELLQKSRLDGLTRLYNAEASRILIREALGQLRPGRQGALLMLDVDHFKSINDTYGHMQGNVALKQVAAMLKSGFRAEDLVCRQGGDEFMVYMRTCPDAATLESKCAALCQSVRELESEAALTISLGAAISRPGDSYESLFQLADQALYRTKGSGRDGYSIAPRPEIS